MNTTRMKKIAATLLAAACATGLVVGVGACGTSNSSSSQYKVSLLVSTMNNPFFVDLRDGAQAEADKVGVDLLVSDAQNDSATQQNQAQNAVSQGAQAVIINPVDSDAATAAVAPLISSNIPVIAVDRAVTDTTVTSYIASDNVQGGQLDADALAKAIGESGKIVILEGTPGAASTRDRGQGFKDEIAKYPNIQIAAEQTANFDRSEALDVTTNMMQSNSDIKAIYAENDEMALGAIQALGSKAGTDVLIFGFDGTDDGLKAVQAGTIYATVAQQPKVLGQKAVDAALAAIKGESVEADQSIDVKLVTKDNVAQYLSSDSSTSSDSSSSSTSTSTE
ncbi:D-ribose ABC transporter substrate-binding protein [Bifidobacterium choloepi]|uniref:D-ribose ABC transporter substrate-binding protein n=1 Tax=Bifidobacterium choloepi TaxID=2614131 RepID=A0A6I5NGM1_9BIFI|nr:D-ribose ABC transporter substrate-binding protein [Bifidobacterium choloepi]NEG70424.1 D-ribose ABC transporter substrate-binding protein [Bifidobacterium choloepi]